MRLLPTIVAAASLVGAMPAFNFNFLRRDDGTTIASPGSVADMIISADTTINSTHTVPSVNQTSLRMNIASSTLPLSFVNNFGAAVNAYVVGLCPNGAVCFIRGDNSIVYPSARGSPRPVAINSDSINIYMSKGKTQNFHLPHPLTSARIYFAAGELTFAMVAAGSGNSLVQPAPNNPSDPSANIDWGFIELDISSTGTIYANLSYVDFVGIALGMQLQDYNGPTQTARGLKAGSVTKVCSALRAQSAKDGYPWGKACITNTKGAVTRVLSPNSYAAMNPNGFSGYWVGYVDHVWTHYASSSLNLKSQCRTNGNTMTCSGDDIPFHKPTTNDIWGCASGPFANTGNSVHKANLAMLCAAFHRSTLLSSGGYKQPLASSKYYNSNPTNHYSRFVHDYELDGKGYAFPYDDVSVGSENTSGTVSSGNPKSLKIWIGGN